MAKIYKPDTLGYIPEGADQIGHLLAAPSKDGHDDDLRERIIEEASLWITSDLTFETPVNIMGENYNKIRKSYLQIEMSQISCLIQQLGRNLQNVYDNFICFLGEEDEEHLDKLRKNVFKNLVQNQGKIFSNLSNILLYKAFTRFCLLQDCDNTEIIDCEKSIAKEISDKVILLFEQKLLFYMEQNGMSLELLKSTKEKMVAFCIDMFAQCLNESGKMNHVESCYIKRTLKQVEQIYDRHLQSFQELICKQVEEKVFSDFGSTQIFENLTAPIITTTDESNITEYQTGSLFDNNLASKNVVTATTNEELNAVNNNAKPLFVFFFADKLFVEVRMFRIFTWRDTEILKRVKTYRVAIIRGRDGNNKTCWNGKFMRFILGKPDPLYLENDNVDSLVKVFSIVYNVACNRIKICYQNERKECILLTADECSEWATAFHVYMKNFSDNTMSMVSNRNRLFEMLPGISSWSTRFRNCVLNTQRELELQPTDI